MRRKVSTFYGINPKTLQIESVDLMRGRTLVKHGPLGMHTHPIPAGRSPRGEVIGVYGLDDVIEVPFSMSCLDHPEVESLKEKAATMRSMRGP